MDILFAFPAILLRDRADGSAGLERAQRHDRDRDCQRPDLHARRARVGALGSQRPSSSKPARGGRGKRHANSRRHVLPNIAAPLIVQSTLAFAWAVIAEAGLSFLGLGTQPPNASWGIMLSKGREFMDQSPYPVMITGAAIMHDRAEPQHSRRRFARRAGSSPASRRKVTPIALVPPLTPPVAAKYRPDARPCANVRSRQSR